ncbi:NACHT domain-containing protein [Umezawaea sp. Da 62-37]|uniref:NACHT domain-containing protein n=1 Tax=Umezawaea sp. Da 62-37 TaxID=3075927 RepID=UPI0028F6E72E|nr:NACHT domain-containing protein [Umezawaea sp. Da 62-37]WNV88530.1 NACHT domain-containing protein [Umezawaea sp. Da 62-37]
MVWRSAARALRVVAFAILGVVTILGLLPVAINVATGGTAPAVLGPLVDWLWPLIIVLSATMVGLVVWDRGSGQGVRMIPRRPGHPSHRVNAVDRVELEVLRRRHGSLAEQLVLKLGLAAPPHPVLHRMDPATRPDPDEPPSGIAEVFAETQQVLLVLGAPGSGKSTLLIDLCAELLSRARADVEQPVPVLLDLANWSTTALKTKGRGRSTKPDDFVEWLLREVSARYRIAVPVGRAWLAEGRLALLLDGLDEVAADDRARCVEQINALGERSAVPRIAVASRAADYERLSSTLRSHHAVRVEPFDREQVEEYLEAVSPRLDGLRTALGRDPELWNSVRTPLMLDLLALTYRTGKPGDDVPSGGERALFDTFLVEMVARDSTSGAPSAERAFRSLRFLARLAASPLWNDLIARGRLPSRVAWLELLPAKPIWLLFLRVQPAVLAGAVGALATVVGVRLGLLSGLLSGLCLTALVIVVNHFLVTKLFVFKRPPDTKSWGVLPAVIGLAVGAVAGLVLGVVGSWVGLLLAQLPTVLGFIAVILITFLVALSASVHLEAVKDAPYWAVAVSLLPAAVMVWTGPSRELLTGLGIGLFAGLATSLFVSGFFGVWRALHVEQWTALPGRGRWWVGVAVPMGVAGTLVGSGLAYWFGAPVTTSVLAPMTGILIGLFSAPTSAREHLLPFELISTGMAELLARPLVLGELPLRRKALLHFAGDRMLLLHVEGEYRFAHALVRDHLASCDPAELGAAVDRRRAELVKTA